jgi:ADP-heptose:LPS heptosyltransferase
MNVLLVRPDGIEDEMLCLPVASAMRRLLPDARITFLSSEYAAPLLLTTSAYRTCCGLAWAKARPWAKRLSWLTQGGRVK